MLGKNGKKLISSCWEKKIVKFVLGKNGKKIVKFVLGKNGKKIDKFVLGKKNC